MIRAGKRLSGKTRKGSQWLRTALVEAAHAASGCKECSLSAKSHHIAVRRGKKRVAVALGHTLLSIIYHLITEKRCMKNWEASTSINSTVKGKKNGSSLSWRGWDLRSP